MMPHIGTQERRLWVQDLNTGISSLAVVGPRLWVGFSDGRIRILADKPQSREWRAHSASTLSFTVCGSRVYSLAADGSIKGWCSTTPSDFDYTARSVPSLFVQSLGKHSVYF